MAEIQTLNTPLMSLFRGLSGGGQNYLQAKTAEEERKRAQMMQDLQSFIAMMPYLQATPDAVAPTPGGIPGAANGILNIFGQGQGAPVGSEPSAVPSMTNAVQSLLTPPAPGGPAGYGGVGTPAAPPAEPIPGVGGVPPTKSIKTPPGIQDVMQRLYGSKYTLGPSAAMRRDTSAANVAEKTEASTIENANLQTDLTKGAIAANAQNREIGGQTIEINKQNIAEKPLTGKQKYIAEEADNYVSSVISPELPLDPKNRQALINASFNAYRNNAPANMYKSQVTREDFAGVVDAKLKQQADDELKKQIARIGASRAGSGTPDYIKGLTETRLNIANMLKDFEQVNGDLAPFITMQREGKKFTIPPVLQGEWNRYQMAKNVQQKLAQATAEVGATGGMSDRGRIALGEAYQLLGGEEVGGAAGSAGGTPPATGYDAGEEWLKSKYPTRPEAIAALNMMVKNGQISKKEAEELDFRIQKWPR